MKRFTGLLLGLIVMLGNLRAETSADSPVAVTKAAYQTGIAHFGFSPEILRHQKPYLAPDVYAALMKKANQPVAKGDAPDIEGDVILNAQDKPDKYEVGHAYVEGIKGPVPVSLTWGSEKRRYLVHLAQIN